MIFDTIENAKTYKGLNERVDRALEEVQKYTAENFPAERAVLDGDNLFLNFASYETHPADKALAEAHRQYLDVMYMVEGEEIIYVKPTDKLQNITKEYDPAIEALLGDLDADATPIRLQAGSCVVLFPQDAHSPGCCVDAPQKIKKIIGKVRI